MKVDLTRASSTQYTDSSGTKSDWHVKIGDDVLIVLPIVTNDSNIFKLRNDIQKLIDDAYEEGKDSAKKKYDKDIERTLQLGNYQLELLKTENERLADALEQHTYVE
jgi:hypothetical protein